MRIGSFRFVVCAFLAAWACSPTKRDYNEDTRDRAATGGSSGTSGAAGDSGTDEELSCDPGFFNCNGDRSDGCEASDVPVLEVPEVRRPLRGAYTGSVHAPASARTLRPTLEFTAVAEICGAVRYEVELDDSCVPGELATCEFASPEVSGSTEVNSFTPSEELPVSMTAPVGAFYTWRVRACDASQRCSEWSDPAHLHVGRTEQDVDGDGYADMMMHSNQGMEIYRGAVNFNGQASGRLSSVYPGRFVGDLNSDGFADIAGWIPGYDFCGNSGPVIQV